MNETPTYGVTIVPNHLIGAIFPKIKPILRQGRKYIEDYYTMGDLRRLLVNGTFQLWVAVEGPEIKTIMFTTLAVYPRSIWLQIIFVGGEQLDKALYCLPDVERWAKAHGAIGTEMAIGRTGWERVIKKTRLKDAEVGVAFRMKFESEYQS